MTQTFYHYWFAWHPVRLSRFEYPHWRRTGEWAWLKTVRVATNIWGETFYVYPTHD